MLEQTWSMGCCTRRIPAVGAAAADPHSLLAGGGGGAAAAVPQQGLELR